MAVGVIRDGLRYTLRAASTCVSVGEPIHFTLRIENETDEPRDLPSALGFRYRIVRAGATPFPRLFEAPSNARPSDAVTLGPRQLVDLLLPPRDAVRSWSVGVIRWQYVHLDQAGRVVFRSNVVSIRSTHQPLRLAPDIVPTVANRLLALGREGPSANIVADDAAAALEETPAMKGLRELGPAAVPALVQNLGVHRVQEKTAATLGALKAAEAVPALLNTLWMSDTAHDRLILGSVVQITDLPSGEHMLRRWDDPGARQATVRALRRWHRRWAEQRGTR